MAKRLIAFLLAFFAINIFMTENASAAGRNVYANKFCFYSGYSDYYGHCLTSWPANEGYRAYWTRNQAGAPLSFSSFEISFPARDVKAGDYVALVFNMAVSSTPDPYPDLVSPILGNPGADHFHLVDSRIQTVDTASLIKGNVITITNNGTQNGTVGLTESHAYTYYFYVLFQADEDVSNFSAVNIGINTNFTDVNIANFSISVSIPRLSFSDTPYDISLLRKAIRDSFKNLF